MNKVLVAVLISAVGLVPTGVAQDKKSDPSEQAAKAGNLPKGKPGPGMVWVDSKKKIYYREGNPLYGKTKKGTYMSEGDAINAGFTDRTEKPIKTKTDSGSAGTDSKTNSRQN